MHVIVVGASGMLSDLVIGYAAEGHTVSAIARDPRRLSLLSERATATTGRVNPISVDYRNLDAFAAALTEAETLGGLPDIGVSWIRSTEPKSHLVFAKILADHNEHCRYVEVRGSATVKPGADALPWWPIIKKLPLNYGIAVLGYIREGNYSRWLHDNEICQGVRAAIDSNRSLYVVGTVEPWEDRPS